jgi:Protein of unknown function (DUF732)
LRVLNDTMTTEARIHLTAIAAACIGAAMALAPIANANDDENARLAAALAANGSSAVSGLDDLVKTAHKVCDHLGSESPTQVVAEWEDNANTVTPGHGPGQVHRTAIAFVRASEQAFCPGFASPSGSHVKARIVLAGANAPAPAPLPAVPDAQTLIPPPAAVAPQSKPAPPQIGPPNGTGGGGGGAGGGTGGGCPQKNCDGPGIVSLVP